MLRSSEHAVILFQSSSLAIRADKLATAADYQVKLIPTPRHLSSDCGISLRIQDADRDVISLLLGSNHVEDAGIHTLTEEM